MSDSLNDVAHVPSRSRFELTVDGSTAVLVYEEGESDVALLHTVVPPELEGRGLGSRLAEAAVAWARAQDLEVVPVCSFVQGWLQRHPDASS
jgi:predicted GNAT family acetyltransferase